MKGYSFVILNFLASDFKNICEEVHKAKNDVNTGVVTSYVLHHQFSYGHDGTLQNRFRLTPTCQSSTSTPWTAPTSSLEPPEGTTIGFWTIILETGKDLY